MTPKDVIILNLQDFVNEQKALFKLLLSEPVTLELIANYERLQNGIAAQFAEYNAIIAKEKAAEKSRLLGEQAVTDWGRYSPTPDYSQRF